MLLSAEPATQSSEAGLRSLYVPSKAFESGQLKVSSVHSLRYEVHGNPKGRPVLVVHGGPGAGCYANHA